MMHRDRPWHRVVGRCDHGRADTFHAFAQRRIRLPSLSVVELQISRLVTTVLMGSMFICSPACCIVLSAWLGTTTIRKERSRS